jgi:hypothetical protein
MRQQMVFLRLYHGRESLDEDMDGWGLNGPIFGPITHVHVVYMSNLFFTLQYISENTYDPSDLAKDPGLLDCSLTIVEDLVYYNGIYYGDWEITMASTAVQTTPFKPAHAYYPLPRRAPPQGVQRVRVERVSVPAPRLKEGKHYGG